MVLELIFSFSGTNTKMKEASTKSRKYVMKKTKKRTRADVLARLDVIARDTESVKKHVQFAPAKAHITIENVLDKGKSMSEARCGQCGEVYLRTPKWGYDNNDRYLGEHFACPNCGNKNVIVNPTRMFDATRGCLILKNEDGFEFFKYSAGYVYDGATGWQKREPELKIDIHTVGVFDNNLGYTISNRESIRPFKHKVLRRQSSSENSAIFWLKDFTHSNVSEDECRALLAQAKVVYEQQRMDSQARKQKRDEKKAEEELLRQEEAARRAILAQKKHDEEMRADPRWIYQAKEINLDDLFEHPIVASIYTYRTDGSTTYKVACGKCGSVDEIDNLDIEKEYTCPHCGNHVEHFCGRDYNNRETQTAIVFENTHLPENDLLIRVFHYHCEVNRDNWGVNKRTYEYRRIFAGTEPHVYYKCAIGDQFERRDNPLDYFDIDYEDARLQPAEEIVQIVSNSALKYSGLIDSWGLGKYQYSWHTDIPDLRYLRAWYKNPAIELVMKSNMENITSYLTRETDAINPGRTIHEILDIPPALVKVVKEHNMKYNAMREMEQMYQYDNTMTYDIYNQIINEDIHRNVMCDIARIYHISYDKILRYLQSAYDHQCILKREALGVWADYLNMASRIGVDLTDKAKLFPGSLKKEHDIAVFAYRAVKIEIDQREFAERAKKNKVYEFETKKFVVIIPETPQEVVEEANAQRNCLRSYIERVKNGETVVAFVRTKADPDKTFLSAEIRNGRLIQLKGYCNSDPRTKEIVEFMNEWAEACNIVIAC